MKVALIAILLLVAGLAAQTWRANAWAGEAIELRRERAGWTTERVTLQAAISMRDAKIRQAAQTEAQRLSALDHLTAGDVSSAFQKGLAAGQALANAQTDPVDPRPAAGGLRDYRALWAGGAYRPAP